MKVGGNESATKFFRANGGSAALASKDSKTKYQSATATKYKEELKKRAARDALEYVVHQPVVRLRRHTYLTNLYRYPEEVVVTDIAADGADGTSTPASDDKDDFFSSWDKPSIKKPTPPISRTSTPPVVGRTASPLLSAGSNIARSASPLAKSDSASETKPAASRVTTSAALRKSGTTGPRKTNVLGAKKTTTKLGAKKVTGDVIDFDEAERKAKEEAERIEKLGYDPEAEVVDAKKIAAPTKGEASNVISPSPISPRASGHSREKSAAEVERLGMGVGRLGFGQVGGPKAAPAAKRNAGGFGSVGPVKASQQGKWFAEVSCCVATYYMTT